jgi:hypothetical protein
VYVLVKSCAAVNLNTPPSTCSVSTNTPVPAITPPLLVGDVVEEYVDGNTVGEEDDEAGQQADVYVLFQFVSYLCFLAFIAVYMHSDLLSDYDDADMPSDLLLDDDDDDDDFAVCYE